MSRGTQRKSTKHTEKWPSLLGAPLRSMFSIVNPSRPSLLNKTLLTPLFSSHFFCFPKFVSFSFLWSGRARALPLRPSAQSAQSMHTISNMCTMLYFRFDICLFKTFTYVFLCVSFSCISLFVFVFGCYVAWSIVVFMCVFLSCPCCRSSLFVSSQSCVCVSSSVFIYIYIYIYIFCFYFVYTMFCVFSYVYIVMVRFITYPYFENQVLYKQWVHYKTNTIHLLQTQQWRDTTCVIIVFTYILSFCGPFLFFFLFVVFDLPLFNIAYVYTVYTCLWSIHLYKHMFCLYVTYRPRRLIWVPGG